jgi:hypothetical protein
VRGQQSNGKYSSPGWTRTSDPLINSQLLYQLSYRGVYKSKNYVLPPTGDP